MNTTTFIQSGKGKHFAKAALAAALGLGGGTAALAADSTTQTATYQVSAINELSVSGNPGALTVSTATAGSAPNAVTVATTTYAITTNELNRKITGVLNTAMPAGVTLSATLAAPTGGTSIPAVVLTETAGNLVTGIAKLNESGLGISYSLSATSAAGVVPSATKTVTLTITAG